MKFQHERLITVWETKKDLKCTTSVLFDKDDDIIFVANGNPDPFNKEGKGYISQLNIAGDIVNKQWMTGLNSPKGMLVHKGRLYVADIDQLVEIDIKKEEILNRYQINSAKQLQDLCIGPDGIIYISDYESHTIFKFKKGEQGVFLKSDLIENVNALRIQNNMLLAGVAEKVVSIDLNSKALKVFTKIIGPVSGIVPDGKGGIFISAMNGLVFECKEGESPILLLDTSPLKISANHIEFIKEKELLLVPTFEKDNIVAYKVMMGKKQNLNERLKL